MGIETGAFCGAHDRIMEVRVRELVRGDVDADADFVSHAVETGRFPARVEQRELAQAVDLADLLGERDEMGRRDDISVRGLPAHQRLRARDRLRSDDDLRLEIHQEFLPLDAPAQVPLRPEALVDQFVHVLGEEFVRVPFLHLCASHRERGLLQQDFRRVSVLREEADSGARREIDVVGCGEKGSAKGRKRLFHPRERVHRALAAHIGDDELVAAEACERAVLGECRLQSLRRLLQQPVTQNVAEGLVDAVEAIETHHCDHDAASRIARAFAHPAQRFEEEEAVRQTRERVVQNLVLQPVLRLLERAHVAENRHVVDDPALDVRQARDVHKTGEGLAALAAVPHFAAPPLAPDQRVPHFRVELSVMAVGLENARVFAENLFLPVPHNARKGGVDREDIPIGIGDENRLSHVVEDGSDERELLFRLFEKLLLDPERFVERPERILPGADERFEFLVGRLELVLFGDVHHHHEGARFGVRLHRDRGKQHQPVFVRCRIEGNQLSVEGLSPFQRNRDGRIEFFGDEESETENIPPEHRGTVAKRHVRESPVGVEQHAVPKPVQRDPVRAVVEERPEEPFAFEQAFRCGDLPHARSGGHHGERKRNGHGGGDHQQRDQDDIPFQERQLLFDIVDVDPRPDKPSPGFEPSDVRRLPPHARRRVHKRPVVIDEPSVRQSSGFRHTEEQRRKPVAVLPGDLSGRMPHNIGTERMRENASVFRHDPDIVFASRAETQVGEALHGDAFGFGGRDFARDDLVVLGPEVAQEDLDDRAAGLVLELAEVALHEREERVIRDDEQEREQHKRRDHPDEEIMNEESGFLGCDPETFFLCSVRFPERCHRNRRLPNVVALKIYI